MLGESRKLGIWTAAGEYLGIPCRDPPPAFALQRSRDMLVEEALR